MLVYIDAAKVIEIAKENGITKEEILKELESNNEKATAATVTKFKKQTLSEIISSDDVKLERMNKEEAIAFLKGRLHELYVSNRQLMVENFNLRNPF